MYALYSAVLSVGLLAYLPTFLVRRRRAGYGQHLRQRLAGIEIAMDDGRECHRGRLMAAAQRLRPISIRIAKVTSGTEP